MLRGEYGTQMSGEMKDLEGQRAREPEKWTRDPERDRCLEWDRDLMIERQETQREKRTQSVGDRDLEKDSDPEIKQTPMELE